ncbi:MAG TPA: hypothetical protein VM553_10710 [Dongiaceae bacterium]|nr:hypothetical protein [Dongiaceae bacterium]
MKKVIAVTFVSLLAATPVLAEYNPLKDAANQVKTNVTTQAQQTKDAQVQSATATGVSVQDQAAVAAKRKALGKSAEGKTDAEVNALYEEKFGQAKALAGQAQATGTEAQGTDLKAVATQKAQETANQKTQEATAKGFDKLNKSLGQ